jgi:hypothetical protein
MTQPGREASTDSVPDSIRAGIAQSMETYGRNLPGGFAVSASLSAQA